MPLFGSTPPSPSQLDAGTMGLLALVSDPKTTKAHLEEIAIATAQQKAASEKILEQQKLLNKTHEEIKVHQEALEQERREHEAHKLEVFADIESRRKALEDRSSMVSQLESELQHRKLKVEELETNLDRRETSVAYREATVQGKEKDLADYQLRLDAMNTSLVSKLEQLKAIIQ